MRVSLQIDSLERAAEHARKALAEWQKYMLLLDVPVPDAHSEPLERFLRETDEELAKANARLSDMMLKFGSNPVLRATFFNPRRRAETEDRYIIRPPDRDIDEPHIFEDTWNCMRRYLMSDECRVDEDFPVYVITKSRPRRVVHVIPTCRGGAHDSY